MEPTCSSVICALTDIVLEGVMSISSPLDGLHITRMMSLMSFLRLGQGAAIWRSVWNLLSKAQQQPQATYLYMAHPSRLSYKDNNVSKATHAGI
eukprot:1150478-Pelagomonas_calceolata.AAC.1